METKIIKAVFGGSRYTVAAKRTRTDYGQVLEFVGVDLPDTFECIFSNSATSAGTGKKMIGSNQRCLIPDEYLATGQTIYAWILLHDTEDDGRHMYSVRIPVADMPDTSPEEPTPVEQSVISQAITVLNSAVDTTTQKAQEATESADRAEHAAEGVEGYAERAEAAQSASESARDIALEAKVSAQASAATATEKASEAISSATTASRSAMTAENASESAQEYATASAESASQAGQSADTASSKASDAQGYASSADTSAQTASQKASEAAQSAQAAVQAKTDAESAKTASQTAQGLAESARDGAVTAKTSAEDARDEAQSIVDGITGKVEQIDSNTDRIESLEDDRYKPYAVDTVSGAVASFPDGADNIPLKSCIVQVEPVQEGSGDPSPDNVRPISGWTGAKVTRTGKNLWNPKLYDGGAYNPTVGAVWNLSESATQFAQDGDTFSLVTSKKWEYYTLLFDIADTSLSYYRHFTFTSDSTGGLTEAYLDKDFAVIWRSNSTDTTQIKNGIFSIPMNAKYYAVVITNRGTAEATLSIKAPQVELGSTATDYEPYSGQTYDITFPTEAGTVYGGTLDVTTGELVMDRAIWTGNTADMDNGENFPGWPNARIVDIVGRGINAGVPNIISNISPAIASGSYAIGINTVGSPNSGVLWLNKNYFNKNETEWKAFALDVQVVLPLASPITYQLTPQEITSLLGQNNLWANTGDIEVEYRADTKLYIEKLTQPEEDDMIADSAINSGQFFMIGNSLYRALANIASGATITVGTNAERVSLSDALNLVNA